MEIVVNLVLLQGFVLQNIKPPVGANVLGGKIEALFPCILDGRAARKKLDTASVNLRLDLVEHLVCILLN
jgi:hypothetical protein